MAMRVTSWLSRPGLVGRLLAQVRLAVRLLREPRVPLTVKAVPLLTALYVVSPVDLVPDVLPVLGQLDDLTAVMIGLEIFLRLCPPSARTFHEQAIARRRQYSPMAAADDVIEAQWRRE